MGEEKVKTFANDSVDSILNEGETWAAEHGGLTKREYFAAKALQGYLSNSTFLGDNDIIDVTAFAVNAADKLVLALNK